MGALSRFLFVVPPLAGRVNPTVALGAALEARGHEVAWAGHRSMIQFLLAPGSKVVGVASDLPEDLADTVRTKAEGLRGMAALQFLWKDFLCPLAASMVLGVQEAVEEFAPDVVVVDQQAFAGAVVARRHGIAWATSATTSAELVDPFAGFPKIADWVRARLFELQVEAGVDPKAAASGGDLRFSEYLFIAFTTTQLAGNPSGLPQGTGPVVMVGPSLRAPGLRTRGPHESEIPWKILDQAPARAFVSLGTVNMRAGTRFLARATKALVSSGWAGVVVADPELLVPELAAVGLASLPDDIVVRPRVDQLEVLRHVDVVLFHAGHNTVCKALAEGLTLVVAPIRDDQPVIAEQVVRCGAGIRVRYGRDGSDVIADALSQILEQPSYRQAASVVQESFRDAGGAVVGAVELEALVN